jgi:bifunctional non-homologous end joining protein LigD
MSPAARRKTGPRRTEHTVEIEGKRLKLSNLEKVLYPASGFTKAQVIDYYARIAPVMLPHLSARPITLKRYPDGVDGGFFYEKRCPTHRPEWLSTAPVHSSTRLINFCIIDDVPGLVWVANLASLEIHTYLARGGSPDRPDIIALDFDPGPPAGMAACIRVALRVRAVLREKGLESFPKVSGGKGLHLYVPLNTAVTFDQTKRFARALAQLLERDDPKGVTSNMRKDLRKGRVFVDWSQNDRHKTTVSAYSLRARERPTVSMPVSWEELEEAALRRRFDALVFEAHDALSRVEDAGDLFSPVLTLRQKLPRLDAEFRARKPAKPGFRPISEPVQPGKTNSQRRSRSRV